MGAQRGEAKEVSVKYQAEIGVAEPDEPLVLISGCEMPWQLVEIDGCNLVGRVFEGFRGRSERTYVNIVFIT